MSFWKSIKDALKFLRGPKVKYHKLAGKPDEFQRTARATMFGTHVDVPLGKDGKLKVEHLKDEDSDEQEDDQRK